MKRFIKTAATVCLAGTLFLTGCAGGNSSSESGTSSENSQATSEAKYKVLIGCSNKAQSFYSWLSESIQKTIEENYPDITSEIIDLKGDDGNVPSMIELAETGGYNGMLIDTPTEAEFSQQLQEARDNGIYTVLVNREHDPDGIAKYVGFNNYQLGYSVGSIAAEKLPEKAKLLVIPGPGDTGALDRRDGFYGALKDAGRDDVTVLEEQNSVDWQKESGMSLMENWTQKYSENDFDAVYCANDDLAVGCIEVCEAAGYDMSRLQFYGIDGLANGCNAVKAGTMTATVLQNCEEIAKEGVAALYNMMTEKDTESEQILVEATVITSDNVDEILAMHEASGMLK